MSLETLFHRPTYTIPQGEKEALLTEELARLTSFHRERCPEYGRLVERLFPSYGGSGGLADIPYIPVGLFKSHRLASVGEQDIFRVLNSSGTTGQAPSRVYLDRETAQLQSAALVATMAGVLGKQRLPMLIVDSENILRGDKRFTARAAGILGMMTLGRGHRYLLDDELVLDKDALAQFLEKFGGQPFLLFGFTFIVWQSLYEQCRDGEFDLSNGVLIHSGGWKKLQDRAVPPEEFRRRLRSRLRLERVYNFYGMVEQVGGVFVEGDDGCLYASNFSDALIRDPDTFEVLPDGETGVMQVLSVLPRSYPGHSILTEDLGYVAHGDDPGSSRRGKGFRIAGRAPRTEMRGCSDTAGPAGGAGR